MSFGAEELEDGDDDDDDDEPQAASVMPKTAVRPSAGKNRIDEYPLRVC